MVEGAGQHVEQDVERSLGDRRFRRHVLFPRQQGKIVRGAHHGAFHEQAVDAAGIVQGFLEAAARFQVQHHGGGAEPQVEIDQSAFAGGFDRQRPGKIHGDRAGPRPAARRQHTRDRAAPDGGDRRVTRVRFRRRPQARQGRRQLRPGHRLDQIVGHAKIDQRTIDPDVVDSTQDQDPGIRLADLGKFVHRRDQIRVLGKIENQMTGGHDLGQGGEGRVRAAHVNIAGKTRILGRAFKLAAGDLVGDEGHEGLGLACRRRGGLLFRGRGHLPAPSPPAGAPVPAAGACDVAPPRSGVVSPLR